jgi:hypothetical protein
MFGKSFTQGGKAADIGKKNGRAKAFGRWLPIQGWILR